MPGLLSTPDRAVVRADARTSASDNPVQLPLAPLITEALRRAFGTQKAGAYCTGQAEGNFSRSLREGTLTVKKLEQIGPQFLAALGQLLNETYGPARVHPLDRAATLLREVSEVLQEARR